MSTSHTATPYDLTPHDPTLKDLLKDVWRLKWFIILGGVFGSICAFIMLWLAVPHYKASMLVTAATRSGGGAPDISSLFPENTGFAIEYVVQSFAPTNSADFLRFEHILRESSIARRLIDDQELINGIQKDVPFYFMKQKQPQTAEELAEYFRKNIKIENVGTSSIRRLIYLHPDPHFAVTLLHKIHAITDNLIRDEMTKMTDARITYLQQAIANTLHPEHKRVLTSLLMEQEHIRMVLNIKEDFAAAIIEPAAASHKPYWPQRSASFSIFILSGLFFGYVMGYMMMRKDDIKTV